MGKIIGIILFIGAGILMFTFWLMAMSKWLGLLGTILAFVIAPGLVIFPIIFWIIEGIFPTFYFIVWGTGIVGMFIFGVSTKDD